MTSAREIIAMHMDGDNTLDQDRAASRILTALAEANLAIIDTKTHVAVPVGEYPRLVEKFDACRAALARRLEADGVDVCQDCEGEWHKFLIEQSDAMLKAAEEPDHG